MAKEKLIAIIGPTAVGKTDLSLDLAKTYGGEIINGDSMQVYRGLDIGTAKIKKEEMVGIPHHLLDILDVQEDYSVSAFQDQATALITEINQRGRLPILVGGSGLYVESVLYPVSHGGQSEPNWALREDLEAYAEAEGNKALWERLRAKDPQAAEKIHENNVRRVVRALEVIHETGETFTSFQEEKKEKEARYDALVIGLNTDRTLLYERIDQRVLNMVAEGLEAEARQLYDQVTVDQPAARGIGYKEWWPYFEGELDRDSVVSAIQKHSRNYAKRQLTWFRNRTPVDVWLDPIQDEDALDKAQTVVEEFLKGEML